MQLPITNQITDINNTKYATRINVENVSINSDLYSLS